MLNNVADTIPIGSLLYVSRSRLTYPRDNDQIESIQLLSAVRNRDLDVTGVLIVTPIFFAQYLEGEPDALSELMTSIRRDARHEILVTMDMPLPKPRRFPNWRMSVFLPEERITRLAHSVLMHLGEVLPTSEMVQLAELIDRLSGGDLERPNH